MTAGTFVLQPQHDLTSSGAGAHLRRAGVLGRAALAALISGMGIEAALLVGVHAAFLRLVVRVLRVTLRPALDLARAHRRPPRPSTCRHAARNRSPLPFSE